MSISQQLFDESVLENQDLFELTPEQALEETLSQYSSVDLSHLCLSHPDEKDERERRQHFRDALSKLDTCVDTNGSIVVNPDCVDWLKVVRQSCQEHAYLVILHQEDGMYTLLSLLNIKGYENDSVAHSILLQTIETLTAILAMTPSNKVRNVQSQLRNLVGASMKRWMQLYQSASDNKDTKLQLAFLELAYVSCRSNEDNKKAWMQACAENGVALVLEALDAEIGELILASLKLITVLCRFDDFRPSNSIAPVVSSSHDHVLEFAKQGAVPKVYQVALNTSPVESNIVMTAALGALRAMAIQDDVVQSMVALGVLKLSSIVLSTPQQDQTVLAATLGLVRNLCANDEVKTTLCLGNSNGISSIIPSILAAMQAFPKDALLQQHACGSMAAMALRKPDNAECIVQTHFGHLDILTAMQTHSDNAVVQRQGALALRNLASRSATVKDVLLEAGAEAVLRNCAGKHQGSVDEAYAALQALGCQVKMLKVKADGNAVEERTQMFGDSKPNFRPVFEPSHSIEE